MFSNICICLLNKKRGLQYYASVLQTLLFDILGFILVGSVNDVLAV